MKLRIESGDFRGTQLESPPGLKTRPTSGKVRAAVFDMLREQIVGARVLDLFCGSGSIGFEALSRGAVACHMVDKDAAALKATRRNQDVIRKRADGLGRQLSMQLTRCDLAKSWPLKQAELGFELIWMDPPYDQAAMLVPKLLQHAPQHLVAGGVLVLEVGADFDLAELELPSGLELQRQRCYGKSQVILLS